MNTENSQHKALAKYTELFIRWNKLLLCFFLFSVSVGLVVYLVTPKTYSSSSLIIYQQQKVNPSKLSPDEERKIEEMVNTVGQQVTSRTSLQSIVKQFDLYPDLRETHPIEDVVVLMRDKDIKIRSHQQKGDVFSVSYSYDDPRKAMLVTNAIASRFIEENIRFREERATETTAYVKDELQMAKVSLDKKESIMRDYKLKYYNEMPDQRAINMQRLNGLQEQYQSIQANIHNLEQTRLLAEEQFAVRKDMLKLSTTTPEAASGNQIDDLETARRSLEKMLAKYTPDHPDVRLLKARIVQLEEERAAGAETGGESDGKAEKGAGSEQTQSQKMGMQLKQIEFNLESLRKEGERVLAQVKQYQQWIETTPVREAEWAALTRDYDELKKHYEYLVAQSLAAEAAESLERRQKGSQFKILDPAYLPEKPTKPDFFAVMFSALGIGLVVGGAFVLLMDFFDTSFRDANELEDVLRVPVLCSVPLVETNGERKRAKIFSVALYSFFAVWLCVLIAGGGYFFQKGWIII